MGDAEAVGRPSHVTAPTSCSSGTKRSRGIELPGLTLEEPLASPRLRVTLGGGASGATRSANSSSGVANVALLEATPQEVQDDAHAAVELRLPVPVEDLKFAPRCARNRIAQVRELFQMSPAQFAQMLSGETAHVNQNMVARWEVRTRILSRYRVQHRTSLWLQSSESLCFNSMHPSFPWGRREWIAFRRPY